MKPKCLFVSIEEIFYAVATMFVGTFGEPQCRLMINVLYLIVTVCCIYTPSTENKWKKAAYTYHKMYGIAISFILHIIAKNAARVKKRFMVSNLYQFFIFILLYLCLVCVCVHALSGPLLSNSVVYDLFTF